jgi:catechol 2,3-dioxygenase-like lactoylglutathione lyase family enzyme
MRIQDAYWVVVTPRHRECRDFYARWFAGEVVFQASWFALLAIPGDPPRTLAFMAPDHPSAPPGPEAFTGRGAFLTFQVADAAAEFGRLRAAGASFVYDLRDEPWGQRRFALRDPAGTWIDVVQQIESASGFWDPYIG